MSKYKYYFKRPKSEVTKDILRWLAFAGLVFVGAGSPYLIPAIIKDIKLSKKYKNKRHLYNAFYRLKKAGCIEFHKRNRQIYISLTDEGKKRAGIYQIDSLEIKKPKNWDGRWRFVFFDIPQLHKIKREVFRGKLKELGFYPFQKSVWVHPYKCDDEIRILRDFLGLTSKDVQVITAEKLEDDSFLKKVFKLA